MLTSKEECEVRLRNKDQELTDMHKNLMQEREQKRDQEE